MTTGLHLTEAAADKIAALLSEEDNKNLKLRVYVVGGGCSGLQYGFTFDENKQEDDALFSKESSDNVTVYLLVDSMSYPYLKDAEIDYTQGIGGDQFVIRNPNAETTCGCGSSFSMKDSPSE